MPPPDLARELKAADAAGHHDVRQHDVDRSAQLASAPSAASALVTWMTEKPSDAQHLARERRNFLVVLDEQHLTAPRAIASRRRGALDASDLCAAAPASERGSSSVTIVPTPTSLSIVTLTAGLLREAVDLRQAQARALADVLGGEERLEHARQHLGRHSAARVGDGELHEVGRQAIVAASARSPAAMVMMPPSGIASRAFSAQVQDRQLELAGVDLDGPQVGAEVHLDVDVPAERAVEHLAHALRWRREVDRLRIDRATAREREQMPRQPGAARDGAAHASKTRCRCSAGDVALEQLQTVGEHREQIVEVVRDAAGQLAERFHLLRLPKRLLGMPQPLLIAQALGDVVDELVRADAVAVAIAQAC